MPQPAPKNEFTDEVDVQSLKVGLILTLVLWPLLVWVLGTGFNHLGNHASNLGPRPAPKPSFEIQLDTEQLKPKAEEPPPDKFVETNPDAPENTPDKTRQFAARNQQVAQEKPPKEVKGEMPSTEGKKDMKNSTQIVDGQLTPPEPIPPPEPMPAPPDVPEAAAAAAAQREQNPLPGFEKIEGDNAAGFGMNVAKPTETPTAVPKPVPGEKNAPLLTGAPQAVQPHIDPNKPQPRKQLVRRVRPAVLQDNSFGTNNVGLVAVNAKFSQYGQYLQQLVETIDSEWRRILNASPAKPPPGSQVTIKFRLLSDGSIGEIVSVESNGGNQFEQTCKSSITNRAPYGKWTDDMLAVLGDSQELTFSFFIE